MTKTITFKQEEPRQRKRRTKEETKELIVSYLKKTGKKSTMTDIIYCALEWSAANSHSKLMFDEMVFERRIKKGKCSECGREDLYYV